MPYPQSEISATQTIDSDPEFVNAEPVTIEEEMPTITLDLCWQEGASESGVSKDPAIFYYSYDAVAEDESVLRKQIADLLMR